MRFRFFLAILALVLVLFFPALGQNLAGSVQASSQVLSQQLSAGNLDVSFQGLGLVSGEMVDMTVTNNGSEPVTLEFLPGMVLDDPSGKVQPIMLEEAFKMTVEPGETVGKTLRGYCLDHSKDAPSGNAAENYELATDLEQYTPAIEVLYSGLKLDRAQKLKPVLRPRLHRTVVLQRSIWASVGEKNPKTQEELASDIQREIATQNSMLFPLDQVDCLSERLWADVQRVMQEAASSR